MLYGIDVSHYQSTTAPGGVSWPTLKAQGCNFAMIRATYGTWPDPSAAAHATAARTCGIMFGLYHFFRPSQPVTDQLSAFCAQAMACDLRTGDIAPALDVEADVRVNVSEAWQSAVKLMLLGLVANFGEAIVYITQREFQGLGAPDFILDRPRWVAHYTAAAEPATPRNQGWDMWQHRVGPWKKDGQGGAFNPDGTPCRPGQAPGPLDQSRAKRLALCITSVNTWTGVSASEAKSEPPPQPANLQRYADAIYDGLTGIGDSAAQNIEQEDQQGLK